MPLPAAILLRPQRLARLVGGTGFADRVPLGYDIGMRLTLLLCLVLAAAAAAEREALTLTDGRTLVGVYDAEAGTVALDGKAVVKVRTDQVKTRELAPARPAPTVSVAQPPPAAAPAKAAPAAPIWQQLDDLRKRQRAETMATCRSWLSAQDLKLLPVPKVGDDPRQSERRQVDQIRMVNDQLQQLIDIREDHVTSNGSKLSSEDEASLTLGTMGRIREWWATYEQLRDAKP